MTAAKGVTVEIATEETEETETAQGDARDRPTDAVHAAITK